MVPQMIVELGTKPEPQTSTSDTETSDNARASLERMAGNAERSAEETRYWLIPPIARNSTDTMKVRSRSSTTSVASVSTTGMSTGQISARGAAAW